MSPSPFDYSASAELYPSRSFTNKGPVRYRRFDTAAEALRYAIEEMPVEYLRGALLEIGEDRYQAAEIKAAYHAEGYPLTRTSPTAEST